MMKCSGLQKQARRRTPMAVLDSMSTGSAPHHSVSREERKVIFASSLGTVFEWYDFYLYGSLAAIIAKHFFAGVNETTAFIFALLAFAAGFAVRQARITSNDINRPRVAVV